MQANDTVTQPGGTRAHHTLVVVIICLAAFIGFFAVFAVWAKRQALETDAWVNTSTKLLEKKAIQDQLANVLVTELFDNVDVQAEVAKELPPELQGLAAPAAGGLRQLSNRAALRALAAPRVQTLWENTNRTAHEQFLRVVESNLDEGVTLNLSTILTQVGNDVGINVAGKIPPDAGQIVILKPNELSTAKDIINLIDGLAFWLSAIALVLMAIAVYLAKGWRREALRSVGVAFIGIGLAILILRSIGGRYVVDALASTDSVKPAVNDTWTVGTSMLKEGGQAMIIYGLFIFVGALLAGPMAKRVRKVIAPLMVAPGQAYLALAFGLGLLFWWAPTEGFHRLGISLLLIALIALGFEVLRRQTAREFPGATWQSPLNG